MLFKFVCISIFCIFCFFERTQLPAAVAAVPFEYNEDHEQYPYDLDTEQSKAKYDTRLLSQQLQIDEEQKFSEESINDSDDHHHQHHRHQYEHNENNSYSNSNNNNNDNDNDNNNEKREREGEREEEKAEQVTDSDDLQPHERAASCYTSEHKYTHGQKVPRLDPCEVCLCMDGEIFCWWEKCEKRKSQNLSSKQVKRPSKSHRAKGVLTQSKATPNYSSQEQPSSGGNEFQTHINKHTTNAGNQHTPSKSLKKKLYQQNTQAQFDQKRQKLQLQLQLQLQQPKSEEYHSKYQHQEEKVVPKHQSKQPKKQQKEQQLQKTHIHDKHFPSSTSGFSSSKIMNFPENLPSVLYYDYHTEEHEHHQHQHHQQHLKHQLQKKIQKLQREHNWQQQQQQKQKQEQKQEQEKERQQKAKHLNNDSTSSFTTSAVTTPIQSHHSNNGLNRNSVVSSSGMFIYDDLQTDSDILPEPPTKKPKILQPEATSLATTSAKLKVSDTNSTAARGTTITTATSIATATANEQQESNLFNNEADSVARSEPSSGNGGEVRRFFVGETSATSSIFATDDVIEINKNINENSQKISAQRELTVSDVEDNNANGNSNDEEQDDAFHRWLTSSEIYNNYNNDSNNKNNSEKQNDNKNNNESYNDENSPYGNENSYVTESSEFENPFGIQNLTINRQQNVQNNNDSNNQNRNRSRNRNSNKNKNRNKSIKKTKNNNKDNKKSNKLLYPKDQEHAQNAENGFLHGVFNNDYSDYNGSVVNIDILLTTQDESRQQQQQQHQQQQQQRERERQRQAEREQLPRTPASIMFAAGLILNRGDGKQAAKTINDTETSGLTLEGIPKQNSIQTKTKTIQTVATATATTTTATATNVPTITIPTSFVQFIRHNRTDIEDKIVATSAISATSAIPTTSTVSSERHCNVMGTLYTIGEILPQDTGNCLQCICIDGSTSDDTPRVTCSPHNCPPLVLPDLFDATGY